MSDKVQKSHRDMYKAKTPPWKDAYRKVNRKYIYKHPLCVKLYLAWKRRRNAMYI
jgi:hypothetical protein